MGDWFIGTNTSTGNAVAWFSGQSQCNSVVLGSIGASVCEQPFTFNGEKLTLHGCGASQAWVTNSAGSTLALCGPFSDSELDLCGVHTLYNCSWFDVEG
ncbi:hypothetical protein DFH09DRAFT_1203229 [Mycena vulgaris]|nr:hypothetical protein DFH09DRAFT_1203229 [Mycena vulgaris]